MEEIIALLKRTQDYTIHNLPLKLWLRNYLTKQELIDCILRAEMDYHRRLTLDEIIRIKNDC